MKGHRSETGLQTFPGPQLCALNHSLALTPNPEAETLQEAEDRAIRAESRRSSVLEIRLLLSACSGFLNSEMTSSSGILGPSVGS